MSAFIKLKQNHSCKFRNRWSEVFFPLDSRLFGRLDYIVPNKALIRSIELGQ